jgi:hypothetical protein
MTRLEVRVRVREWLCRSSFSGRASFTVRLAVRSTFYLEAQ